MRIVALAFAALASGGCRAESAAAEPAAPAIAEPVTLSATVPASPTAPPTTVPEPAAAAPAASTTAAAVAKPSSEREDPPAGCIARVEDLPEATFLRSDDRRLTQDKLLVVDKGARRLMLFEAGRSVACYKVGLGFAPDGHKLIQGDGRTPEGWYRTSDKPWSSFDNAIAIHYPNAEDARAAAGDGRIAKRTRDAIVGALEAGKVPPQSTKLGGAVLIHGGGSSWDWTLGCVALDDDELLALREQLPKGMRTDVLILP